MRKPESQIFDIWDNAAKKSIKGLDQHGLAKHRDLLNRDDCHMIQHTGAKAYNGRDIRRGDVLRHLKTGDIVTVSWEVGGYVLRNELGTHGFWGLHEYEVIDNRFEAMSSRSQKSG